MGLFASQKDVFRAQAMRRHRIAESIDAIVQRIVVHAAKVCSSHAVIRFLVRSATAGPASPSAPFQSGNEAPCSGSRAPQTQRVAFSITSFLRRRRIGTTLPFSSIVFPRALRLTQS